MAETLDPDLADEWTTAEPAVCHGCVALGKAHEDHEKSPTFRAMRFLLGLREGWENRLAERRARDH